MSDGLRLNTPEKPAKRHITPDTPPSQVLMVLLSAAVEGQGTPTRLHLCAKCMHGLAGLITKLQAKGE